MLMKLSALQKYILKQCLQAKGFGEETAQKWFINQVKLTAKGKKVARGLLGVQQKLPFKKNK